MNLEFSLFLCISLEQNTFIVLYEKLIVKFFSNNNGTSTINNKFCDSFRSKSNLLIKIG